MARKTDGFSRWVGKAGSWFGEQWNKMTGKGVAPDPVVYPKDATGEPLRPLKDRLDERFEQLMQEVDELSQEKYTLEEHAEYGWIVLMRLFLPLALFLVFGYEDGLFMTGFNNFSWEPFILLMYVIGYGLEGLRVAMVYSMNFSKGEGRDKAYRAQLVIWLIMSAGCGVAQLASALVIQALGGHEDVSGGNAIAQGAKEIMAAMPWLVYLAIGIRVALCALADLACSGFLHKKKQTVEQKVARITTRANNLSTVLQAHVNAQSIADNAKQFQEMVSGQREELKELRSQQKSVFDVVFQAGMRQINKAVEPADKRFDEE